MHIHIPRRKYQLDPSGKKGLFVGYSEQSKSYQIYIPGYRQIELSRDFTFDEDTTFEKSNKYKEDEEKHGTPKAAKSLKLVRNLEEDHML